MIKINLSCIDFSGFDIVIGNLGSHGMKYLCKGDEVTFDIKWDLRLIEYGGERLINIKRVYLWF